VTRQARRRYAREWLAGQFGRQRLGLRTLKPHDLLRFVNARSQSLKGTSVRALAVGLRSFLRFLEFTGRIRPGLASAVPCPASPPSPPPTHILDPGTRLRFLRSFGRTTPVGRRDYAIALCFSELALRANEVAALTLDDVDWRALTVRLRQTRAAAGATFTLALPSRTRLGSIFTARSLNGCPKACRPWNHAQGAQATHAPTVASNPTAAQTVDSRQSSDSPDAALAHP